VVGGGTWVCQARGAGHVCVLWVGRRGNERGTQAEQIGRVRLTNVRRACESDLSVSTDCLPSGSMGLWPCSRQKGSPGQGKVTETMWAMLAATATA
jgi:hypothetical protein